MRNDYEWQEYDWRHNGKASVTHVDAAAKRNAPLKARLPVLLIATVSPRKHYGDDYLSPRNERRFYALEAKMARRCEKLHAHLAASRIFGNVLELYMYCTADTVAQKLQTYAEKPRWAFCECVTRDDPDWKCYFDSLYPNRAQQQTILNRDKIALMQKYGDNIHQPRPLNHYASFPDEVSRAGFQNEAKAAGYALGDVQYIPEAPLSHNACVRNISTIVKLTLDEHTSTIVMLAEKYGGRYDSWDCKIMSGGRRAAPRENTIKIYKAK